MGIDDIVFLKADHCLVQFGDSRDVNTMLYKVVFDNSVY